METLVQMDAFRRLSPINYDLIEPNLYLGTLGAASDPETLKKNKITHVLTIEDRPLSIKLDHITYKYIELSDLPNQDILSYFDETDEFIKEGITNGAILVHCFFGVSRSATLVIAYLMKKYQLTYDEAYNQVQAKRNQVYPNSGFIQQLKIYYEMGYKLDFDNLNYKSLRLKKASDQIRRVQKLSEKFQNLIKPDPGLNQTQSEEKFYLCKKCQRILASEANLIPHKARVEKCTRTLFFEPLQWMNVENIYKNKLNCPKCKNQVGFFDWIGGYRCSCDVKISPAFCLTPSDVILGNI